MKLIDTFTRRLCMLIAATLFLFGTLADAEAHWKHTESIAANTAAIAQRNACDALGTGLPLSPRVEAKFQAAMAETNRALQPASVIKASARKAVR